MSHEIHADYEGRWLFPPSLEDLVPPDHPARFVRELVASLDLLGLGFEESVGDEGRPRYSSELLLKV
jgi:transposase